MLKMKVEYLTPSGKTLKREKLVVSLKELEDTIRIMRATGFTPLKINICQAGKKL